MEATELIELIRTSEKKTPVRVVLQANAPCEFPGAEVFSGGNGLHILYGDWKTLGPQLTAQAAHIDRLHVENGACNSAIPMLDLKGLHARVEPGAIIREGAEIGANAVVMMGAILNLGAVVGEGSMIDMGAVLGGRATVGKNCHIGAGAVLAGVIEPPSATPVIVEDGVLVGANAVVLEGSHADRIKAVVELYPLVDGGPVPDEWSYDLYEVVDEQRPEALSRVDRIRLANNDLPPMYVNGDADKMLDPLISALFAEDVSAFPRTVIISSEYDYLRYQDELFAKRLQDAGVDVTAIRYRGCDHGFFEMYGVMPQAEDVCRVISEELAKI